MVISTTTEPPRSSPAVVSPSGVSYSPSWRRRGPVALRPRLLPDVPVSCVGWEQKPTYESRKGRSRRAGHVAGSMSNNARRSGRANSQIERMFWRATGRI